MARRTLILVALFLLPCLAVEADASHASDVQAIHQLIDRYAEAVSKLDLNLLSQVWSHSPEVSFVYPLGEEHGYDAIEQNIFRKLMGGMFSTRTLETSGAMIHVNANAAWSEFHWIFHATLRKDGTAVTTRGVETQIYGKEAGAWRLVHVHYSEERQPAP